MASNAHEYFMLIRKKLKLLEEIRAGHSRFLEKNFGITSRQYAILKYIDYFYSDVSVSVSEISRGVGLHITTVEGIINRLNKAKFVAKQRDRHDRRVVKVRVTEKAKKVLQDAPLGPVGLFRERLHKMPEKKIVEMLNMLDEVVLICQGGGKAKRSKDNNSAGRSSTDKKT